MSVERWRDVVGRPGYEVSTLGRIRSTRRGAARVLTPTAERSGHLKVRLAGVSSSQWLHRLVAGAFLGPCPTGQEVRHIDGDPTNNVIDNLAYGTRAENVADQLRHGTHPSARKTHCPLGHPYAAGRRRCSECRAATKAKSVQKSVGVYVYCPQCGDSVSKLNLRRHMSTTKCEETRGAAA